MKTVLIWVGLLFCGAIVYSLFVGSPASSQNLSQCITDANTKFSTDWSHACSVSYTGLAQFLSNCDLPTNISSVIEENRNNTINECYSEHTQ